MDIFSDIIVPTQPLIDEVTHRHRVSLFLKREDLNHAEIMGNKLRKLKYNIIEAKKQAVPTLLSFGGAYSNHILALSAAGRLFNMPTIGVIRGEELAAQALNPVLDQAKQNGMTLHFVSRQQYKLKNEAHFIDQLQQKFGPYYAIPEGGSNALGVKGAAEILDKLDDQYDVVICACGTGGTLAGLIKAVHDNRLETRLLGISVLKDNGCQRDDIVRMLPQGVADQVEWQLNTAYHCGGYAKVSSELLSFMHQFRSNHATELDTIYTGKMMYGVYQLIQAGYFTEDSKILLIHTGGTQTAPLDA